MSSADPFDVDYGAYDSVLAEANKDTLTGKHNFVVTETPILSVWPNDGREYYKVRGALETAGNFKIDFALSAPASPEEIRAAGSGRAQGMRNNIESLKALKAMGKAPGSLKFGDSFQVLVYREKSKDPQYERGFARISKILGPPAAGGVPADVAADPIPGFDKPKF